jgi:hypothetical protein
MQALVETLLRRPQTPGSLADVDVDRLLVECRTSHGIQHARVLDRVAGLEAKVDLQGAWEAEALQELLLRAGRGEKVLHALAALVALLLAALLVLIALVAGYVVRARARARSGSDAAGAARLKRVADALHGDLAAVHRRVDGMSALVQAGRGSVDNLSAFVQSYAEEARRDVARLEQQGRTTEQGARAAADAFAGLARFMGAIADEREAAALERAAYVAELEADTAAVQRRLLAQARLEADLSRALEDAARDNARVRTCAAACAQRIAGAERELLLLTFDAAEGLARTGAADRADPRCV